MDKKMKTTVVMMTMVVAVIMVSSQIQTVQSSAFDCYDACSTGCVQPDTRLMSRCDRKCQIRCGPAAASSQDQQELHG